MSRRPRFNLVGIPHHIIQHGNNRDPCFIPICQIHPCLREIKSGMYYRYLIEYTVAQQ